MFLADAVDKAWFWETDDRCWDPVSLLNPMDLILVRA